MILGQILVDKSIRDSMMFATIIDQVEEIRIIKNGSAHTGASTKEKVERISNKI